MATICSLIVSLIAETSEFISGFDKAEGRMVGFERTANRISSRIDDVGKSFQEFNSMAAGIGASGSPLLQGVASDAEKAAGSVSTATMALSALKSLASGPIGITLAVAVAADATAQFLIAQLKKRYEENERNARMPINDWQRVANERAVAEFREKQVRQNALNADIERRRQQGWREFYDDLQRRQPAEDLLKSLQSQRDELGLDAGALAARRMEEALKEAWNYGYGITQQEYDNMVNAARDAANETERRRKEVGKIRQMEAEMERRTKRNAQLGLFGGLPAMSYFGAKPQPAEPCEPAGSPGARMFGTQEAFMREANKPDKLTAIAQQQLDVQKDMGKDLKGLNGKAKDMRVINIGGGLF